VRPRWPTGPVAFPRVIAVYRKYHLACEALNEKQESDKPPARPAGWGEDDEEGERERVSPQGLLLDSLEAIDPELSRFMEKFVFIPIGVDAEGVTA
jgi:hypothetical protein